MIKIVLTLFALSLLVSCGEFPVNKPLTEDSKQTLDSIKYVLKLESLKYSYTEVNTSQTGKRLYFTIYLSDVDKPANYDTINKSLLSAFERSGYDFKNCYTVSIRYFKSYERAKVWRIYQFDNKKQLKEIRYQ